MESTKPEQFEINVSTMNARGRERTRRSSKMMRVVTTVAIAIIASWTNGGSVRRTRCKIRLSLPQKDVSAPTLELLRPADSRLPSTVLLSHVEGRPIDFALLQQVRHGRAGLGLRRIPMI